MGRKSFKEELQLFKRYSELTAPYFEFLQEMFNSEKLEDKKWATERIEKAFIKMIPQDMDITSDGLPLVSPEKQSDINKALASINASDQSNQTNT
jgi:hypothetical protein